MAIDNMHTLTVQVRDREGAHWIAPERKHGVRAAPSHLVGGEQARQREPARTANARAHDGRGRRAKTKPAWSKAGVRWRQRVERHREALRETIGQTRQGRLTLGEGPGSHAAGREDRETRDQDGVM